MQDDVDRWRSQLRKGSLELAVLACLARRPAYGLELVDTLNAASLGISEGSIYPLLARLRAEKKVTTEWVDGGVGHAHKVYDLTDEGRRAFRAMRAAWTEFGAAMDALLDGAPANDSKEGRTKR